MVEFIPKRWFNIIPKLPKPLPPPRDPEIDRSSIEILNRILPEEVLKHQFTVEEYVDIPSEVVDAYRAFGRPTPLLRATKLEERLSTPARIYFKFEGALPTGSHKLNAAIPQTYYALKEGNSEVVTETGAGQWGAAVALSSSYFGLRSVVFMVRSSYMQKPQRRQLMELYGSTVNPSPSDLTKVGMRELKEGNVSGSLATAMGEAVEYALDRGAKYMVGSVLDVVLMYQSVIGQETIKQLEVLDVEPDVLVGCVGGGSNFAGFTYPIINSFPDKEYVAVGASEIPKFSMGVYRYDYPDSARILPLLKMITLGVDYRPPPIYSGGLRYHGVAPSLSVLITEGVVKAAEVDEREAIEAGRMFARLQGIVPALESAHAVAYVIKRALEAKEKNERINIVFNLSGHGLLELNNYAEVT